jgi:hypothetical protein
MSHLVILVSKYQTTPNHTQGDSTDRVHHCENFKPHVSSVKFHNKCCVKCDIVFDGEISFKVIVLMAARTEMHVSALCEPCQALTLQLLTVSLAVFFFVGC